MASPYTQQTVSGYNTSAPPDDGSSTEANQVTWAGIKTKLADPVKTLADNIDDAVSSAFLKSLSGGGPFLFSNDYQILDTDQGQLLVQNGSNKTFTTPLSTAVGQPFVFAVLNIHATDNLTLDGSGSETVNGAANKTIAAGKGAIVFTDGSGSWYAVGL